MLGGKAILMVVFWWCRGQSYGFQDGGDGDVCRQDDDDGGDDDCNDGDVSGSARLC